LRSRGEGLALSGSVLLEIETTPSQVYAFLEERKMTAVEQASSGQSDKSCDIVLKGGIRSQRQPESIASCDLPRVDRFVE
jgi:hypothetical protein